MMGHFQMKYEVNLGKNYNNPVWYYKLSYPLYLYEYVCEFKYIDVSV